MTGHDEAVQIARDALPADIRGRDMWARDVVAALTGEYDLAPKGELAALRAVAETARALWPDGPAKRATFAALDAAPVAGTTSGRTPEERCASSRAGKGDVHHS